MNNPLRGEIWRVQFNPTRGDEIQKTRPAIIISIEIYPDGNWRYINE